VLIILRILYTIDTMKSVLISGVKPTARPHIGNYFGAMKQFVDLQEKYESYIFVAEYHALTTIHDSALLHSNTRELIKDYLAIGINPEKTTLYKQSSVPQVTEFTWILNCLTTIPYLERAHAFKDNISKGKTPSVGLFDYPVLMAADILLSGAHIVPVGKDQKQHVEMTRELALKFNTTFEEIFTLPQELILEDVAIIPGIDGKKMSKSYNNTIPLFAEEEQIRKLVFSIVTSSSQKGEPLNTEHDTLFSLHTLVSNPSEISELRTLYKTGAIGYKESKELLVERLNRFIQPLREKRKEWEDQEEAIAEIIENGNARAYHRYEDLMEKVRHSVGLR
jgi:tryptophanyl-tRNA synthetase